MLPDGADLVGALRQMRNSHLLYVEGAITDSLLAPLLRSGLPEGFTIVARDAGRLLLSADSLRGLSARKGRLGVLESVHLAAVAINPYSVYGYDFDEIEFLRLMKEAVSVPVVNVLSIKGDGDDRHWV